MQTQYFKYKKHTDTWFWIISTVIYGGFLAYIIVKIIIANQNQLWKVLLTLSPFLFIFITLIRIVVYRQEYEKVAGNTIIILDKEIPKLTVVEGITKKEILPSEIGHLKLYETYVDSPSLDFTYIEIVLKTGESIIIPNRIADIKDLNLILKGKRRIRKKRFMNRIKTTGNNTNN